MMGFSLEFSRSSRRFWAGLGLPLVIGCSAGGASDPSPAGASGASFTGSGGDLGAGSGGAATGSAGGTTSASGGANPSAGGTAPGAGGTAVLGAGGGTSKPFAGYDPSVAFDWPETAPTAGSCKPGKYSGTFDGTYVSPAAFGFPVPIAGNVDLTLQESEDGEFFKLANGKIAGLVYGIIPFSSELTGTLNCTTLKLEDGYMPKGTYNAFGTDYFYEGPLDADYDKLTNSFVNGNWRVGEPTWKKGDPDPTAGGFGTWTVNWVSP